MTIIKGSHSGVRKLEVTQSGIAASAAGAAVAAVNNPNQSFGYLTLPDPANPPKDAFLPKDNPGLVIGLLKQLGDAMIEDSDTTIDNSDIPPVYTYWGQFIDHDITAGTDRASDSGRNMLGADILQANEAGGTFDPEDPRNVIDGITNLRLPELDLDSVYGGGPTDQVTMQEGMFANDALHLKVGSNIVVPIGSTPNPNLGLERDLFRDDIGNAKIGDARNDENLIIAQFHTAFLKFHNAVVDQLGTEDFDEASQLVRWHYQWLVVNDYLPTICQPRIVDQILAADKGFFNDSPERFMPLEFSVAAFRFGHSMVRAEYDFNLNFGPAGAVADAEFNRLFEFTFLKGNLGGNTRLLNNWIIEWDRFTDKNSPQADRFARKIDTNLAIPLTVIPADRGSGGLVPLSQLSTLQKHLAQRNLLRSYLLSIPTAQHVAKHLGISLITDLIPDNKPQIKDALAAEKGLLLNNTPLWYYVLREAEVQTDGNALGELGSHLVAGTLIGLLKSDPSSYLNYKWDPSQGVKVNGQLIERIMDLFHFAGVA